jgi:hypothetical protein
MPAAAVEDGLVSKATYRGRVYYGRRAYVPRRYYARRAYRPAYYGYRRGYYRPAYYPYRGYRPVYRAGPRTVCRTRVRVVRTVYGNFVRRPVRVCTRRW